MTWDRRIEVGLDGSFRGGHLRRRFVVSAIFLLGIPSLVHAGSGSMRGGLVSLCLFI